jgi:hypothetical protein
MWLSMCWFVEAVGDTGKRGSVDVKSNAKEGPVKVTQENLKKSRSVEGFSREEQTEWSLSCFT